MHLANHALGLISLDAMEAGRIWFLAFWRNFVGTVALYGSLLVHFVLALFALYQRRHLRMPAWQMLQVILGLLIPLALIAHVVFTRLAHEWFDTNDTYTLEILAYWQLYPDLRIVMMVFMTVAWVHGCIGIHFWLRLKPWYARIVIVLFSVAVLTPILAMLGAAQAGREISRLAQQAGWIEQTLNTTQAPDTSQLALLELWQNRIFTGFILCVVLVFVARGIRRLTNRGRTMVRIDYPDGSKAVVPVQFTVLEASRQASIPHASVCGGRGRCSTCRVRITQGAERLPPANESELRVLKRVGASPNVRLACQLRPTHDLAVIPLLPATAPIHDTLIAAGYQAGQEREIAVLFADLRGFTRIAEHRLPYDVVFLLNQYFEVVGNAIEQAGGVVNQFTGDGVMALFGIDTGSTAACQHALAATQGMVRGLADLSRNLAEELDAPLRIGIGIHTGPTVVGRMGRGEAMYLTAVGDTVHVASRLQDLTKTYSCQLIISEAVAECAGMDVTALPRHELTVRNRGEPIVIRTIDDVDGLG